MTFERTFDADYIRRVLTDPALFEWITDDSAPAREAFRPLVHESFWYVRVTDRGEDLGLFLFVPQNFVCWEVHTALLPIAWGERAAEAARLMSGWIWKNTPCRRITTTVPRYNRLALRFAQNAGMRQYGVNEKSYLKRGRMHDQLLLGMSPPAFAVALPKAA